MLIFYILSLLKYEEVCQGNSRRLIVKNITEKDFATFACEAKGEKCSATLSKKSPWVLTLQNIEGQFDGIAVFEVLVKPGVQVSWFRKGFPIVKENFRFLKIYIYINYKVDANDFDQSKLLILILVF